jgi:hypothetical protein
MLKFLDKFSTFLLRYIPFLLAFLTPLFFLPITADPFTFNKFYLVTFLASLSLLSWCVRSLVRGKLSFTASPSLLPLLILVAAHLVSSLWLSPIQHVSLFGQSAFFISLLIIFITTTSSQKNRALIDSVIFGLVLSTSLLSLTTILHHFDLLNQLISLDLLDNKFFSPAGGILVSFIYTLPVLIATMGFLIVTKNWLQKSLLFASVIIMIVASLINLTLVLPQGGQPVLFLLPYRASWSIAVDIFKNWQTALFGTGPDTYLSVFTRLKPGFLNVDDTLWSLRFPESGSFFLTLITTIGLVGSLSFVVSFLKPISLSLKHRAAQMSNPSFVFLSLSLITSLVAFILTPASIALLVFGVLALITITVEFKLMGLKAVKDVSLSLSAKNETESFYQNLPDTAKASPYVFILPWVTTLLSLVLLIMYWIYAVPAYSASMQIKQAGDIIGTNPVGAYLKELEAARLDPFNSTYPMLLSQFFDNAAISLLNKKDATADEKTSATEYMQRAIDYGKKAATLNPYNVIVWENLATIYQSFIGVADGAQNFAVSHFAQAISLDPTNPELRLKLGVLFFNLGDVDQSIKLVGQAIELKQNWSLPYYNMGLIYRSKEDNARALQYLKAGLQYAEPDSEDYTKFQEEISALEKLAPAAEATPSATPN